ncbi:uncharacterized protein EAF01_009914 [Botrytis porri]|uniref:Uncharacterized protein n=1 Tax=Botrytis porri TaxID=87229 RepID=A0A4Z1L442_9HELO|nr:uncharacterized protein EAF01_009914 [Botrytis porri]KAF7894463.1 hypothetical protein EAF01_009914 [Botrytis porri]TGO91561.1 hypothetical protein BPOR_0024g00170 [Botrytis porri]
MSQDAVKATKPIVGGQVSVGVGFRTGSSTTGMSSSKLQCFNKRRRKPVRSHRQDVQSSRMCNEDSVRPDFEVSQDCHVIFSDHKTKATLEMVNGASNGKETAKSAQQSKREWYKQELTGCRTITSASWGRPRMVRARTRPVLIYNSIKAEDVLFLKRSMRFV